MRLSAMGDVAMTVPVLRFCNQYPEVKITVISDLFQTFFEGIPILLFFAFDEKNSTNFLDCCVCSKI
jgi:hypothetical protein